MSDVTDPKETSEESSGSADSEAAAEGSSTGSATKASPERGSAAKGRAAKGSATKGRAAKGSATKGRATKARAKASTRKATKASRAKAAPKRGAAETLAAFFDRPTLVSLLVVVSASLVAAAPILANGYPQGHDWIFGLVRVVEYEAALGEGQWPPLWVPNQYNGLGSLLFLYYGHGYLATTSAIAWLFPDILTRAAVALVLLGAVAGLGAWLWGRAVFGSDSRGQAAARVMGVAFAMAPYLACNRLLRTANAEFAGLCFLPFAFAGIAWLRDKPRFGVPLLALGLGAAIASHNMVAIYGTAFAALAVLGVYFDDRPSLVRGALGGALGLAIGAFYWLPAFGMKGVINADAAGTYFVVTDSLMSPSAWVGGEFYAIGAPLLLALVVGAALGAWVPAQRRWTAVGVAGVAIALWMTTSTSAFLWENAPLLPYFQFCWRIFGLFAIATPIVLGCAVAAAHARGGAKVMHGAELGLALLCVLSVVPRLQQTQEIPEDLVPQVRIDATPERVRTLGMSATLGDQFVPAGVDIGGARARMQHALQTRAPEDLTVFAASEGLRAEVLLDESSYVSVATSSDAGGTLTFARWDFVTWRAFVDGERVETRPDGQGLLQVDVPPGQRLVELRLVQPPLRWAGLLLSLCGFVGALVASRSYRTPAAD